MFYRCTKLKVKTFFPLLFIVFGDNVPHTLEKGGGGLKKQTPQITFFSLYDTETLFRRM